MFKNEERMSNYSRLPTYSKMEKLIGDFLKFNPWWYSEIIGSVLVCKSADIMNLFGMGETFWVIRA